MKNLLKKTVIIALSLFVCLFLFSGCEEVEEEKKQDTILEGLGWFGDEDLDHIESDIYFGSTGTGSVPSQVNLLNKFPPIGNQGSYGTCVAWSVGYNLKTYLEAVDQGYSQSQLSDASKQFSPKYLFWAIPTSKKGSDCNGTSFEAALDIMVSQGIATQSTVSYDNLGDCSNSPQSSWNDNANNYKIENYRKITIDEATLKSYLAQERAVAIGAKLGENFMKWNTDNVLTSDGDTYNGQHAYHAMILSGYDDSKGPNGAFRVVNSWGTNWGDAGYIWVDYNFFNDFCFAAFVAKNKTGNPDEDNDNVVDDDEIITDDIDLVGWELDDYDHPDEPDTRKRKITYNVFNVGDETIYATKDWNIIYIYYNAYDAEDYGILLYDYYSDDYGSPGDDGSFSEVPDDGDGISGNWWNYIDVPGGVSVAQALYGSADSRFKWGYTMPSSVDGDYYLVLIADGYDVINEYDETNNYFFFTQANGDPLVINGGIIDDSSVKNLKKVTTKPGRYANSPSSTTISKRNPNAYSPQEISKMLQYHKKTGELQKKVNQFLIENNNKKIVSY